MGREDVLLGSPGCNGLIMPKQSKKEEKARVSKNTSVKELALLPGIGARNNLLRET